MSGIGSYRILNSTYPTHSDNKNTTQTFPIGILEIGSGWITSPVPRNITLKKAYTFLFSVWGAGNGNAVLFFEFYAYRNGNEHFLFSSDPSNEFVIDPTEMLWIHQTKEVTLQILEGDRLVLRLFINVTTAGTFGLGYDCIQYPSYIFDPSSITLRPNGAGDLTECSPLPSVPNWQNVDEEESDGDSTTVLGNVELSTSKDLYTMSDGLTCLIGSTINSVTVYNLVRSINNYHRASFSRLLKVNGTVVSSVSSTASTTYTNQSTTWTTNPVTGLNWTISDLDEMQNGVSITPRSAYNGFCTQVFTIVLYTEETTKSWQSLATWNFQLSSMMWQTLSQWAFQLDVKGWRTIATWFFILETELEVTIVAIIFLVLSMMGLGLFLYLKRKKE